MEKDVDEVGKIAHMIKTKLQEIDRDVLFFKVHVWKYQFQRIHNIVNLSIPLFFYRI